jgi:Mn-dependent DtxR family transcriptional regulator
MAIKKSAEDYLETMLILREEKGYIRSIDIAEHLGVTKPSVSYATKHLRESGHITMDRDGMIKLTATGMAVATKIYERHKIFSDLLIYLGVNPDTARKDACEIEHDVSDETFDAIRATWQRVCNCQSKADAE